MQTLEMGVTVCDSVRSTLLGLQMSLDILNARSQAELQDTQILSEVKFSHLNSTMWVALLLHWGQASFHILQTHFWGVCLHPLLWMMHCLTLKKKRSPWQLTNGCCQMKLVKLASCVVKLVEKTVLCKKQSLQMLWWLVDCCSHP